MTALTPPWTLLSAMNALQLLLQQQLGPLLSLWHYSASKLSVCDRVCVCVRDCSLVLFWSFPYCNSQRSNLQFSFSTHTNLGLLQKRRRTLLYKWLWLALVSRSSKGALPTAAPDGMPHSCRFIVQGGNCAIWRLFESYLCHHSDFAERYAPGHSNRGTDSFGGRGRRGRRHFQTPLSSLYCDIGPHLRNAMFLQQYMAQMQVADAADTEQVTIVVTIVVALIVTLIAS